MILKIHRIGAPERNCLSLLRSGELTNMTDIFLKLTLTLLSIYSFAVYVGSSIYSPTTPQVMEIFGVGEVTAALGLSLYVLACGFYNNAELSLHF